MKLQGAVIKEQGVTFAVVIVKKHILNPRSEAEKVIQNFQKQLFPGMPVVLMAQDSNGTASYCGRSDLAKFLANLPLNAIPWKEYTF